MTVKKIFICVLSAVMVFSAMIFSLSCGAAKDVKYLYGDINGDGQTTAMDYLALRLHIVNEKKLKGDSLTAADVNKDGAINAMDYLAIRLYIIGVSEAPDESSSETSDVTPKITPKIAYIPLDDRPVNVDRVIYLAESAGFELLIPQKDLYSTKLDGQPKNSNSSQIGNRAALLDWLKSIENDVDYYVISIDQMLSGGLVGSRWLSNTDLSLEYSIADYLISLTQKKHVYLFDTVMRLASTVGFDSYGLNEYNELRKYGMQARKQFPLSDLSIENIVNNYKYDENGNLISTSIDGNGISKYLAARKRKLTLTDYLLKNCDKSNTYCFVGIDDSSPKTTIQTNEIKYIDNILGKNGNIFGGTDELGMMAVTRLCTEFYKYAPTVKVTYFGGGENEAADVFGIETLKECVDMHIESINGKSDGNNGELQILVLTKTLRAGIGTNARLLFNKAVSNINSKIPTVIIDCSENKSALGNFLPNIKNLGMILGYSSWNTAGNAVGIAISQGVSRFLQLKFGEETSLSKSGFIKSITFDYCKDLGYKVYEYGATVNYISSFANANNFYSSLGGEYSESAVNAKLREIVYGKNGYASKITAILSSSEMFSSLKTTESIGKVTLGAFSFPWYRTFEMTFEIQVKQ